MSAARCCLWRSDLTPPLPAPLTLKNLNASLPPTIPAQDVLTDLVFVPESLSKERIEEIAAEEREGALESTDRVMVRAGGARSSHPCCPACLPPCTS